MPYIPKQKRELYNPAVDRLITDLVKNNYTSGELNYCVSKLVWSLFEKEKRYSKANELVGAIECVKQEFIRRKLNIYEDQKIEEEGDL